MTLEKKEKKQARSDEAEEDADFSFLTRSLSPVASFLPFFLDPSYSFTFQLLPFLAFPIFLFSPIPFYLPTFFPSSYPSGSLPLLPAPLLPGE